MKRFTVFGKEIVVLSKDEKQDITERINKISAAGLATVNQVASEIVPLMEDGTWKKISWMVSTDRRKKDIDDNWNALRGIFT